jgi:uncharacterized Tic20 family protein
MTDANPQPAAPQPTAQLTTAQDNQWASFAHLGGILGFLPALIIWLVFKDRGAFTSAEAKEALNFQITIVIAYIIANILVFLVIGAILLPIIFILSLIFSILGFTKAKDGTSYRYPFAIRLIK